MKYGVVFRDSDRQWVTDSVWDDIEDAEERMAFVESHSLGAVVKLAVWEE